MLFQLKVTTKLLSASQIPLLLKNTKNIFRLALRSFLLFSPLFSSVSQHNKLNVLFLFLFWVVLLKIFEAEMLL